MAEYTASAAQTVAAGQNVLFNATPICGRPCVVHRDGAGVVTLRGLTNQCRARYKVSFFGNIAVPTGGTAGPISIALAVNGEALPSATMISTPAAVEQFNNVAAAVYVDVPRGCCVNVAVQNVSGGTTAVDVQNANLIVTREA